MISESLSRFLIILHNSFLKKDSHKTTIVEINNDDKEKKSG